MRHLDMGQIGAHYGLSIFFLRFVGFCKLFDSNRLYVFILVVVIAGMGSAKEKSVLRSSGMQMNDGPSGE